MPDLIISDLPAATLPLAGTELVPIVQGGITERVAVESLVPRFSTISSSYIAANIMGGGSQTPTANRMLLMPYTPRRQMTVQRFRIRTHSTSGASDFALAIYGSAGNGLPTGAPVYGGAAFTPTYNFVYVGYSGLSLTLEPRRYWLAFVASAAAGSYTESLGQAVSGSALPHIVDLTSDIGFTSENDLAQSSSVVPFINSVTPGTWPTLTGAFTDFSAGRDGLFRLPSFSFQVA